MEQTVLKNTLPETGFLRLTNIIGDAKASLPIPAIYPGFKKYMVGRRKIRSLSKIDKIGPKNYSLARRGYPRTHPK